MLIARWGRLRGHSTAMMKDRHGGMHFGLATMLFLCLVCPPFSGPVDV